MSAAKIQFPLLSDDLLSKIEVWWQSFKAYESELNAAFTEGKEIEPSVVDFMDGIKTVNPDMCWEFSKGGSKPHRFTIAPERNYEIEPIARLLKAHAPDMQYFEIGVDREATPWEWMSGEADSRFSWDSHDGVYVTHAIGQQNFIDLTFHIPASKADAKQEANAFLLSELALGEKVVADWIGYVDVEVLKEKGLFKKTAAEPPAGAYPIKDIRTKVAGEIARFKNSLPQKPFRERVENMEWSIIQMADNNAPCDYLDDMYLTSFSNPELFTALYSGRSRFNSQRFSSLGESFVFIQTDGVSSGLDLKDVSSRGKIEDALTEALGSSSLGAVIGGAMGQNNAYIFLALEDETAGLNAVVESLRTEKLGEKTWIFFCDSRRQFEWVGLWPDTSAPQISQR